ILYRIHAAASPHAYPIRSGRVPLPACRLCVPDASFGALSAVGLGDLLRIELRRKCAGCALLSPHLAHVFAQLGPRQAVLPKPGEPGVGAFLAGVFSVLPLDARSEKAASAGFGAWGRGVRLWRLHALATAALWGDRRICLDAARILGHRRRGR